MNKTKKRTPKQERTAIIKLLKRGKTDFEIVKSTGINIHRVRDIINWYTIRE